jgi:hypothetical protein
LKIYNIVVKYVDFLGANVVGNVEYLIETVKVVIVQNVMNVINSNVALRTNCYVKEW